MAVYRWVNLDIREAEALADLTGIASDLRATVELCDLLEAALKDTFQGHQKQNPMILDALTTAALVRYSRSFASGVRAPFPEEILNGLPPELAEHHRWFKDLRDKYVAHSVNAFEQNVVVAYLAPEESGTRQVLSISVQEDRLASLSLHDVNRLKMLCQELRARISEHIERERARVLQVARNLPVDKLYAQEARALARLDRATVKQPRKRM